MTLVIDPGQDSGDTRPKQRQNWRISRFGDIRRCLENSLVEYYDSPNYAVKLYVNIMTYQINVQIRRVTWIYYSTQSFNLELVEISTSYIPIKISN